MSKEIDTSWSGIVDRVQHDKDEGFALLFELYEEMENLKRQHKQLMQQIDTVEASMDNHVFGLKNTVKWLRDILPNHENGEIIRVIRDNKIFSFRNDGNYFIEDLTGCFKFNKE